MGREEGDKLLNALLPFAQQMLAKYGSFHPFGAFINANGEPVLLAAYEGNERPESKVLIEMMVAGLQKDAPEKGYKAVGICCDAVVLLPKQTEKTDAIEVDIEYADGEALVVCLPYKKGWFGKIQYGKMVASAGEAKIFRNSSQSN